MLTLAYKLTDTILELYRNINDIHMRVNQFPVGPIMLADFFIFRY